VRFVALQSVVCSRPVGVLVPHPRHVLVVSDGKSGFYRLPSPARLRKRVHPLVSFTPLQSPAVPCPPRASRRRAPSLGSAFPSSRLQPAASLRRDSTLAAFPSSAFLTPSTVSSAAGLVGLFHPTATSRVRSPGVFPLAQPSHLVGGACPLVGWRRFATGSCPPAPRSVAPPSGLCSVRRVRCRHYGD